MVGINGIGGVPEPPRTERPPTQNTAQKPSGTATTDGVEISPPAVEASSVGARIGESAGDNEIRKELVAEVRQRIEDGTYELQGVVTELASRISKFVG